jgi:hypothetical protein
MMRRDVLSDLIPFDNQLFILSAVDPALSENFAELRFMIVKTLTQFHLINTQTNQAVTDRAEQAINSALQEAIKEDDLEIFHKVWYHLARLGNADKT